MYHFIICNETNKRSLRQDTSTINLREQKDRYDDNVVLHLPVSK